MRATFRSALGAVTAALLISAIAIQAQQAREESPQARPMTPAELELRRAMRTINSDKPALRAGMKDPANADMAKVKAEIGVMKAAFQDAETFFKDQKAADAVGWVGEALKLVATIEAAASSTPPKWDEILAVSAKFDPICSSCHKARRERLPDGSYRFKAES